VKWRFRIVSESKKAKPVFNRLDSESRGRGINPAGKALQKMVELCKARDTGVGWRQCHAGVPGYQGLPERGNLQKSYSYPIPPLALMLFPNLALLG
jgi:hypothetical protein